jgi:ubiquinone/menaquinone biosynthesis C-methylase UbiE
MSKVLEITDKDFATCQDFYKDAEVTLYNPLATQLVPFRFEDEEFDAVWAHHTFQYIPWRWTGPVFMEMVRVLKDAPDAVIHIFVPSIRWIGKQWWQESIPPHVKPILFGEQTGEFDIARNAMTLREFRTMFDQAGLAVIKAKVGVMEVEVEDEVYQSEQIYVAGVKNAFVIQQPEER